jgi:ABC-2 type transport system permease protein
VVLGYTGGGVLRGLLVGLVVTVISLIFTNLPVHHLFVILLAVLLTAIVFSLAGFINGVFAKNFDQVNWIPTFILTPLTYFGGVFYSINLLPDWARTLSFANPVLHMVNAFRYGFLGRSDVDVLVAFGIMTLAAALLFGVALWLMERGIGLRD